MSEGAEAASAGRGTEGRGGEVPLRLLVHLGIGAILGTIGGYAVGTAIPTVFIDAVHAGFHAGWLGGLASFLALTRRRAAEAGRSRGECIAVGGILLGGTGFVLGFYGPILFAPGANQGPLLGIFVTGPAGSCIGAAGGWLWHRSVRRG